MNFISTQREFERFSMNEAAETLLSLQAGVTLMSLSSESLNTQPPNVMDINYRRADARGIHTRFNYSEDNDTVQTDLSYTARGNTRGKGKLSQVSIYNGWMRIIIDDKLLVQNNPAIKKDGWNPPRANRILRFPDGTLRYLGDNFKWNIFYKDDCVYAADGYDIEPLSCN